MPGGRAKAVGKMPEHASSACHVQDLHDYPARQGPPRFTKGVRRLDLSSRRLFWPNGEWNRVRHDQSRFKQKLYGHVHGNTIHNCPKVGRTHVRSTDEQRDEMGQSPTQQNITQTSKTEWRGVHAAMRMKVRIAMLCERRQTQIGHRRWRLHLQEIFRMGRFMETACRGQEREGCRASPAGGFTPQQVPK